MQLPASAGATRRAGRAQAGEVRFRTDQQLSRVHVEERVSPVHCAQFTAGGDLDGPRTVVAIDLAPNIEPLPT